MKIYLLASTMLLGGIIMADTGPTVNVRYDESFNPEKGKLYQFKDFILEYQGVEEMSREERALKEKSSQQGIDGGASMITDSKEFRLLKLDYTYISKVAMQMNPYSWARFEVNGKKFNIEYDESSMVVRDGPLLRNRPKDVKYYESFNRYEEKGIRFPDFDLKFLRSEKKDGIQIKQFYKIFKGQDFVELERSMLSDASPISKFVFRKKTYILTTVRPLFLGPQQEGYMESYLYPEEPSPEALLKYPKLKTTRP